MYCIYQVVQVANDGSSCCLVTRMHPTTMRALSMNEVSWWWDMVDARQCCDCDAHQSVSNRTTHAMAPAHVSAVEEMMRLNSVQCDVVSATSAIVVLQPVVSPWSYSHHYSVTMLLSVMVSICLYPVSSHAIRSDTATTPRITEQTVAT